jgi:hypothetical protein
MSDPAPPPPGDDALPEPPAWAGWAILFGVITILLAFNWLRLHATTDGWAVWWDVPIGWIVGSALIFWGRRARSIEHRQARLEKHGWRPGDIVSDGHVLGADLVWRLPRKPAGSHRSETAPDFSGTRMPLGQVSTPAAKAIQRQSHDGPPWLVLAPASVVAGAAGVLAAWDDRLSIIKAGLAASWVAGSLGGERTGTFFFTEITGIEYNSGIMQGVLEVLTPSYRGGVTKDFWGGTGSTTSESNPMVQNNTLPLAKSSYNAAISDINELRRRISEVKAGSSTPAVQQAAPSPTAAAEEIKALADLRDQGILTEQEFAAKKAQILGL